MEARLEYNFEKQPKKDRLATIILLLGIALALNCITVDVFYLNVFARPSFFIKALGLGIFSFGYGIIILTMIQNKFAQSVTNIQDKRNHVVVDQGLYSLVRHPMYTGFMFFFSGVALWLGSIFMASIGTIILMTCFIPRINIEEETLAKELDGYSTYLQKIKYRILPKIY